MKNNPAHLNMIGRLKFLAKDSIIYGGASAVSKLFALFTFPILARHFSVEDYGIIDAFNVLGTLFVSLLIFGQDSAVARYFYEYDSIEDRKIVISESLSIQIIFLVLVCPILWLYAEKITFYYTGKVGSLDLIRLVILQIPFGLLINFSGNILKWTFEKYKFLFLQLGSTFFYVVGILVSIYFFQVSVIDVFKLFLYTRILFGLVGLFYVFKWFTIKFTKRFYKNLLSYGVPYGLLGIVGTFLPALDRYFINLYLDTHALGIYAVAYKIAFLIQLPINAFQTAWGPFYLSLFKEKNAEATFNYVLLIFTSGITAIGLVIILFAKPVILFLAGEKYNQAVLIVIPLVFGLIIMSIGWILGIGIDLAKKSILRLVSTIIRFFVSGIVILLLINKFSLLGIAIGFLSGYLVSTIFDTILSYKIHPIRFELRKPAYIILIAISCVYISFYFNNKILITSIYNSVLILIFVFIVWAVPLQRKNLKLIIKGLIK